MSEQNTKRFMISRSLSRATRLLNIFLMEVNFDKSITVLHLLFISSLLANFNRKLKINSYVINKLFKLQVFVI